MATTKESKQTAARLIWVLHLLDVVVYRPPKRINGMTRVTVSESEHGREWEWNPFKP